MAERPHAETAGPSRNRPFVRLPGSSAGVSAFVQGAVADQADMSPDSKPSLKIR
jgi:hypothetical protein